MSAQQMISLISRTFLTITSFQGRFKDSKEIAGQLTETFLLKERKAFSKVAEEVLTNSRAKIRHFNYVAKIITLES